MTCFSIGKGDSFRFLFLADLIMLGLATHEPNFTIIREEFIPFHEKPCELCGQFGRLMNE